MPTCAHASAGVFFATTAVLWAQLSDCIVVISQAEALTALFMAQFLNTDHMNFSAD